MHVYIHTYTPRTYLLTCIHKYVHACLQAPVCAPFRPKSPHTKGRRANHEPQPQPQLLQRRCQLCPASVVPVLPSFFLRADVRRKRMCVYTYAYVLYSILYMCACVCTRTRLCAHAHTETRTYLIAHNKTHTHTAPQTARTGQGHGQNSHAPDPTYRTLFPPTDVGTPVCVCPCSAEAALAATTALVVACLLRFRLRPLVKQR